MKKESNSDEKNILKSETNEDMIDWWVGTVILTFFPILTSIIINICRNGYADFNRMVGDGELILLSIPIKMSTFFGNSEHPFPEK